MAVVLALHVQRVWNVVSLWVTSCLLAANCASCGLPDASAAAHPTTRLLSHPHPNLSTVRLIGTVGNKKDLKVFERSKLLPFSIAVKMDRRKPDEVDWFNVEAWGPLAERAEQQVQKGDRVAVQVCERARARAELCRGGSRLERGG